MKKLFCQYHEEQLISCVKPDQKGSQLICDDCLFDLNQDQDFRKIIHISKALKKPEFLLSRLIEEKNLLEFWNQYQKYDEEYLKSELKSFEIKMTDIQNALKAVQQELAGFIKKVGDSKKNFKEKITQLIQHDSFVKLVNECDSLENDTNIENLRQSQEKFNQFFDEFNQNIYGEKLQELLIKSKIHFKDQVDKSYPELKKLEDLVKTIRVNHTLITKSVYPNFQSAIIQLKSTILDEDYAEIIVSQILQRNRYIKSIQLLYWGTRDQLNSSQYWSRVSNGKNLLIIFKSRSGNVFGGYTPCQWNPSLINVQDESLTSFLFSQTHNLIFPLKQDKKGHAITISQTTLGPCFGGPQQSTCDIHIGSDFQSGSSNLGYSYQWDDYQNLATTYLFGQQTPNISDCEVFAIYDK